jgi:hypothetical protein
VSTPVGRPCCDRCAYPTGLRGLRSTAWIASLVEANYLGRRSRSLTPAIDTDHLSECSRFEAGGPWFTRLGVDSIRDDAGQLRASGGCGSRACNQGRDCGLANAEGRRSRPQRGVCHGRPNRERLEFASARLYIFSANFVVDFRATGLAVVHKELSSLPTASRSTRSGRPWDGARQALLGTPLTLRCRSDQCEGNRHSA